MRVWRLFAPLPPCFFSLVTLSAAKGRVWGCFASMCLASQTLRCAQGDKRMGRAIAGGRSGMRLVGEPNVCVLNQGDRKGPHPSLRPPRPYNDYDGRG